MPRPHSFHRGNGPRVQTRRVDLSRQATSTRKVATVCATCTTILSKRAKYDQCHACRAIANANSIPPHGTPGRYNGNSSVEPCRCEACSEASRECVRRSVAKRGAA